MENIENFGEWFVRTIYEQKLEKKQVKLEQEEMNRLQVLLMGSAKLNIKQSADLLNGFAILDETNLPSCKFCGVKLNKKKMSTGNSCENCRAKIMRERAREYQRKRRNEHKNKTH